MVSFIDAHRGTHGIEPICKLLPIAPSTYYEHPARRADPARLSDRARRDAALRPEILRFVGMALVIDVLARLIVGGRVSTSAHAGFVPDALEQAVHERRPAKGMDLVPHSDRGSQYCPSAPPSASPRPASSRRWAASGDSYDNALAETINGHFEAEVIYRRGPWRSFEAVEYVTLEGVDWFNNHRLLEPIGNLPPAEAEANLGAALETQAMAAQPRPAGLRQTRRGSHHSATASL